MFNLLFIFSIGYSIAEIIKEKAIKEIPVENFENKVLWNEDTIKGVPAKEMMKNLKNGKYKLVEDNTEYNEVLYYQDKPIVEKEELYKEDMKKYGLYQTHDWLLKGKYSLPPDEREKQQKELDKKMKRIMNG